MSTSRLDAFSDYSIRDSWSLIVLGDLHMEDDMSAHEQARADCVATMKKMSLLLPSPDGQLVRGRDDMITVRDIVQELEDCRAGDLSVAQLEILMTKKEYGDLMKCHLVSLGDLGRKDIRHEPGDAGTSKSFTDAKIFFEGFGIPYDLVTGNHDLEGLDEFISDVDNMQGWMDCFVRNAPQFMRQIGEKTILIGISTTRFRESPFSSHECHIDDEQLDWFQKTVRSFPASEGWKIIVFSHAPIMGSGLRVLQNVHVQNGCAWLNHCSENRNAFIRTVKANPQIKLWFSGHFHLSHDYEDSISQVDSCTFVQVGVIGPGSTRDGRRQTRFVQGCADRWKVYTINHHQRNGDGSAFTRLDADIDLVTGTVELARENQDFNRDDWFQAYTPRSEDGCYLESPDGSVADPLTLDSKVCWWHMADGKILGLHQSQLVEYDAETLCPLGIVATGKHIGNREVVVVEKGTALVLVDRETNGVEVVHPNDDGSYWRKFQRNKRVRQEEKAREAIAKKWLERQS